VESRDEEDISVRMVDRAHHSFSFPSPKRERKLSDEGQQEEAKRPKLPERVDMQPQEQHGSGGEGGEEMEREMRERLSVCMTEETYRVRYRSSRCWRLHGANRTFIKGATGLPLRVSAVVGHRSRRKRERKREGERKETAFFLVRRAKGSLTALLLHPILG
jgi:hypothetical protein